MAPAVPRASTIDLGLAVEAEVVNPPTVRELFDRHARFVLRVLRSLGVDDADLDDAAQEVFVVVHRRLGSFDVRSNPKTWLFGIALRVASTMRRSRRRRRDRTAAVAPPNPERPGQQEELERAEARALLGRALSQLDDDKRAVFVLYELEGFSISEISEALGCPPKTVYSRLYAARERLREYVARHRAQENRP